MADILNGNWITHDKPMQAKTEIRIEAHNAEANLSNLLSVKIDLTDETPAVTAKIKSSKIFSDTGDVALFTQEGYIEEAVKIKGYTETLKAITTLSMDKAKSQCQLYIDSNLCLAEACLYKIIKIAIKLTAVDGEVINPFTETSGIVLTIGSISFSSQDLYDIFKDCYDLSGIPRTETHKYINEFTRSIYSELLGNNSYTVNENALNYYVGGNYFVWAYIYVPTSTTVYISTDISDNVSLLSPSFGSICVHISGVSGLCSGLKVDTGLPPSNIFKTSGVPDMLFNCNPFNCMTDYDNDGKFVPSCMTKCPYGAIKHKQTLLDSLPVDTAENQLQKISELKMIARPYEIV